MVFIALMQVAISYLFGQYLRSVWMFIRSSTWWEDVVLNHFGPCDWRENFRECKTTFDYLCHNLQPLFQKANTSMRRPVSVERCVAVTLWMPRVLQYCPLFGLARYTVCQIVHKTCKAISIQCTLTS